MLLSGCRAACLTMSILLASGGVGFAQSDLDDLRIENQQLRLKVAQLEAQLSAMQGGTACETGAIQNPPTTAALMRKLAQFQRDAALQDLGLSPGPRVWPLDILGAYVPGEYIILTRDAPAAGTAEAAAQFGLSETQITQVYKTALRGFAARLSPGQAKELEARDNVIGVVKNGFVFAAGLLDLPKPQAPHGAVSLVAAETVENPVDVYLFDTGIRQAHSDLRNRVAQTSFSYFDNGLGGEDCSGHGTHVAARIAGHTVGSSSKARLVSVKVMDQFGAGDVATVIAGIDWVMAQPGENKLVNMSLTRRVTQDISPLDMAVQAMIDAGATVVVAAGNAASDAADFTPARVADAITVGSVNGEQLSSFSNAGRGVDLYGPGEKVVSASIRDVCGLREMSGTSMAAPMVTGLIANLMYDGMDGLTALDELLDQAQRVRTNAYKGERRRYILSAPKSELGISQLCDDGPLITYDDGLDLLVK